MSPAPAEMQVQHLVFKLFYALDTRDYHGVADCFHDDGVWLRQGKRLVGKKQMVEALELRSPTMVIHHVATKLTFHAESDTKGKMVCYLTAYRHDPGKAVDGPLPLSGPAQVGFCRGELTQVGGEWRLSLFDNPPPTFLTQ